MLVVIAIIGILAALLSGPLMRARRQAQLAGCINNLKQLGTALIQYTNKAGKNTPPVKDFINTQATNFNPNQSWTKFFYATNGAGAITRLFIGGQVDNMDLFFCPVAKGSPERPQGQLANRTTVLGWVYEHQLIVDYALTVGYSGTKEPGNKIVIADSPLVGSLSPMASIPWFNGKTVYAPTSIHDLPARFREGPGMLYQDNHVKVEPDLCPKGSSQYPIAELLANGYPAATLHPNSSINHNIYIEIGQLSNPDRQQGFTIYGFALDDKWPWSGGGEAGMSWAYSNLLVAVYATPHPTYIQPTGSGQYGPSVEPDW
jgi:type II secretory pathway pseudopilin PulG